MHHCCTPMFQGKLGHGLGQVNSCGPPGPVIGTGFPGSSGGIIFIGLGVGCGGI